MIIDLLRFCGSVSLCKEILSKRFFFFYTRLLLGQDDVLFLRFVVLLFANKMLCLQYYLGVSISYGKKLSLFHLLCFNKALLSADGGLKALFVISAIVMILICIVGILTACRACHPICKCSKKKKKKKKKKFSKK